MSGCSQEMTKTTVFTIILDIVVSILDTYMMLKNNIFLKNFTSLVGSNFAVQMMRFFTIILLTRKLGPELFGVYNYILVLISLCAILVEFGLKNYGVRQFSLGHGSWKLIGDIFKIRFVVSIVSILIVAGFTYSAFKSYSLMSVSTIFAMSLIVDSFLIDFVVISKEKLYLQAIAQLAQASAYLLCVYLILFKFNDLKWIAAAFSLSHVFLVLIYFLGVKNVPFRTEHTEHIKTVFSKSIPYLVASIVVSIQYQLDILLLGQFHFNLILGDYSACLKLLSIPLAVVYSFYSAVLPRIAKLTESHTELLVLLKKYFKPVILFVLIMNFIFFIAGKELVYLFFGEKYKLAPLLVKPLAIAISFHILTILPMQALFLSKETGKLLKITILNFLVSCVAMSVVLFFNKPLWLPITVIFVQMTYCFQAWRHFLKK